jgi:hypothetical protein
MKTALFPVTDRIIDVSSAGLVRRYNGNFLSKAVIGNFIFLNLQFLNFKNALIQGVEFSIA